MDETKVFYAVEPIKTGEQIVKLRDNQRVRLFVEGADRRYDGIAMTNAKQNQAVRVFLEK